MLPDWTEDEVDMLEVTAEEPNDGSRLSCQIKMTAELDGITVTIPGSQ
jgi:ferredoxin, 2Fe-2S